MKHLPGAALILFAASLAGFIAAVVIRGMPALTQSRTELKTVDWDSYSYQASGASAAKQFNIKMVMKKKSEGPCNVRLAFNQQDQANYYFVEFGGERTRIAKVQDGFEIRIGIEGRAARLESSEEILIKRRALRIEVYFGREPVASAFDDTYQGGRIFLGQVADAVSLESFRFQPVGDLLFSDDFMKAAMQEGEWDVSSGNWKVETLKNPGLSSNAFYMVGTADSGAGIATTGHWFWDDYSFQISCRPMDGKPVGILTCYRGPEDYYLFRWDSAGEGSDGSRMKLIRVSGGKVTLLAAAHGGYTTGQWYELQLSIQGKEISAAIDGNVVLRANDSLLCSGRIGVFTEGTVHFDDVYVVAERSFRESFAEFCPGKWQELGGTWRYGKAQNGKLEANANGPAKMVAGSNRWRNYKCSVDLVSRQSGDIGLCSHYQGEGFFYLMRWLTGSQKLQLVAFIEGKEKVLDEVPWSGPKRLPSRFTIETLHDIVRGSVDGKLLLASVVEEKLSRGKAGLWVEGGDASFDNLEVSFPKPEEPVLTLNEVFAGENSMADWSTSESDWIVRKEQVPNGEKGEETLHHYWHRSDFPGDCDLKLSTGDGEAAPDNFTLTISGDGTTIRTGYQLIIQKRPQVTVSLYRNGTLANKQIIEGEAAFSNMKLSRQGDFILAYLDGRRVLSYRDSDPLTGDRVAFSTRQKRFDTANLRVYSRNFYSYNFQKAPGEWRQAGGIWKVTNRWQCDPRWSFFSGESDRIAAIWNKRIFEGDLSLEFSAGIKMNSSKGQGYEYASDINATICADGNDLTSGYSFLFGGKGNSGTQLVRKTEIVAESPERIPRQVLHRRWFAIKIQKRGGHLTLWIDNRKILEYTDPNPLPGRSLALWTYNNGLMVSRVRISSESGRTMELPDADHPQVSRSIYD